MNPYLLTLIFQIASINGVDPLLVASVAIVESGMDVNKIGEVGEIGILQIRPQYYPKFNLFNPEVNIKVGVAILKEAQKRCKYKDNMKFIICYNHGITGGNKIKYPKKDKYYLNILRQYDKLINVLAESRTYGQ